MKNSNVAKIEETVDTYLKEQETKYTVNGKTEQAIADKLQHIKNVVKLTEVIAPGNDLARVAAKAHDLGRFPQYDILGAFNDGKVLHHYLGEDLIGRWLYQGKLENTNELGIIRQSMMFHGRDKFIPSMEVSAEAKDMCQIIGAVDNIENGCLGAPGYLSREAHDDVKGYKANLPELDQGAVSKEVMDLFRRGEKWDKMKLCHTYAEYALFAGVLAIDQLKEKAPYREVAKKAMELPCTRVTYEGDKPVYVQEKNTLEAYDKVFDELVSPEQAKEAKGIFKSFYEHGRNGKIKEESLSR